MAAAALVATEPEVVGYGLPGGSLERAFGRSDVEEAHDPDDRPVRLRRTSLGPRRLVTAPRRRHEAPRRTVAERPTRSRRRLLDEPLGS